MTQLKFLAFGCAPDFYTIDGEVVTAHHGEVTKSYDLSDFPENGAFQSAEPIIDVPAVLNVERIDGELHVTLLQQVIAGQYPGMSANWRGQRVISASEYDPDKCYVTPTGMVGVEDYEILRSVDVAGFDGWTVRKREVVSNG